MRVLVVDNYDSFVYNLVQYLTQLGADCTVQRNDAVTEEALADAEGVLLSPGPGTPERAGACMQLVQQCAQQKKPVFGVCLGHQAIGAAWGGVVEPASELLHGKVSQIHHVGDGLFAGLPNPFRATRYHSLAVHADTIPAEFEVTAWTDSHIVMGMRHTTLPMEGVQFHPESILTEGGHRMLANWMARAGHHVDDELVSSLSSEMHALAEVVR